MKQTCDALTGDNAPALEAGRSEPPAVLEGHWATSAGHEMAVEYAGKSRDELAYSELTDMELANAVYMANRHDLSLIHYQTAAKERIRWLSVQLALAKAEARS